MGVLSILLLGMAGNNESDASSYDVSSLALYNKQSCCKGLSHVADVDGDFVSWIDFGEFLLSLKSCLDSISY